MNVRKKYCKTVISAFLGLVVTITSVVSDMIPVSVAYAATDVTINSLSTDIGNAIYNQEGSGNSGGVNTINGTGNTLRSNTSKFNPNVIVNQTGYGSVDLSWQNYYDANGNSICYDKNYVINASEDNKKWHNVSLDYRDVAQVKILQIYPDEWNNTVGMFNEMNYMFHTIVPAMDDLGNFLFKNSSGKLVYVPADKSFYALTCQQLNNYKSASQWTAFFQRYAKSSIAGLTPMFTTLGTGNKYYADFNTVKSYIDGHAFSNGSTTIRGVNYATANIRSYFKSSYPNSSEFQQLIQPDSVSIYNFAQNPWYYLRASRSIKHALAYMIEGGSYRVYWNDGSSTIQYSKPDGTYNTYVTHQYYDAWGKDDPTASYDRVFNNGFGVTGASAVNYVPRTGITWYVNTEDTWRYNVTVAGLRDGGLGLDAPNIARNDIFSSAIQCSILAGRGHYMGHDGSSSPMEYMHYVVPFCGGYDCNPFMTRSSKERVINNGLIMQYPWYIGSTGDILPISVGHTWHYLLQPDTKVWTVIDGQYDSGPASQAFTFTRNNCGIISSGDLDAQALGYNAMTFAETAIIANMGFYCNQLIFNKYGTSDKEAVDKTAPSAPVIKFTSTGWTATSSDKGNTYYYRIQSYDKDHGTMFSEARSAINGTDGKQDLSTTVKVNVQTGVRKYVYKLDNSLGTAIKPTTKLTKDNNSNDKDAYKLDVSAPGGCVVVDAVDITAANNIYDYLNTKYDGKISNNNYRYIHVCAIDGAGNVSETTTSELTREYKVIHQLEQADGSYVTRDTDTVRGVVGQTIVPSAKSYTGYTAPALKTILVSWSGSNEIVYKYKLIHYKLTYDTQGGEWYKEKDDGTWVPISAPPSEYTVLTPDIHVARPDKVGYTFTGWTGTGISTKTLDVVIPKGSTGNRSYVAQWEAQSYDVEVPVSLVFSVSYNGVMTGSFDQTGNDSMTPTGYLHNNSLFPVQTTSVKYENDSVYTMSDVQSKDPNIMNWRLDASNNNRTYNKWATELDDTVNTSSEETYWMAQKGAGKVVLDAEQAWYRNDVPDIKDKTKIGRIVWTFDIGHRKLAK